MPLEHGPTPRFTPDQRDAILDLAARLQVQHEATVGADELVRAAEEAGIDARFVYEATVRLREEPRPTAASSVPLVAFALLVIEVVLYFYVAYLSLGHGGMHHGLLNASGAVAIALPLAIFAARRPTVRWFVPLAPIVVWTATAIPVMMLTRNMGEWVVPTALFFGLVQSLAALIGTLVVGVLARASAPLRDVRVT